MLLSGPWYICGVRSRGKFWLYLWHSMAWRSQVSTHRCRSLHRAQHDDQHHPFTRSSICEDLLWDSAQPMAWHWSLLPAGRAANLASPGPQCHSHDPGSSPSICPLPNTAWSQPEAGQHQDSGQVWTPQKLAPRCKGAVYSFCPFPSFPEHVSLMSLSISCLLLCACSPLCCFPSMPAFPQLGPSSTCLKADRQSYTWWLWGKIESVLCCIN